MGLYTINCPTCKELYQWFSGNTDQRCFRCQSLPAPSAVEAKGETITFEQVADLFEPEPSLGQKLIEAASECLEPSARDPRCTCTNASGFPADNCRVHNQIADLKAQVRESMSSREIHWRTEYERVHSAYQKLERELAEEHWLSLPSDDDNSFSAKQIMEAFAKGHSAGLSEGVERTNELVAALEEIKRVARVQGFMFAHDWANEALKRFGEGK